MDPMDERNERLYVIGDKQRHLARRIAVVLIVAALIFAAWYAQHTLGS